MRRRVEERLDRLPKHYRAASLSQFASAIVERILAWLLNPTIGLRLTGAAGTGKTHLAAGVVRHRIETHEPAIFRRFSEIYASMRECYSTNTSEKSVMRELYEEPFAVFDDLGSGSLSDHERRITLDILDERINGERFTVVTTNWSLADIERRMDERIASRLSSFLTIELTGRDRRIRTKI